MVFRYRDGKNIFVTALSISHEALPQKSEYYFHFKVADVYTIKNTFTLKIHIYDLLRLSNLVIRGWCKVTADSVCYPWIIAKHTPPHTQFILWSSGTRTFKTEWCRKKTRTRYGCPGCIDLSLLLEHEFLSEREWHSQGNRGLWLLSKQMVIPNTEWWESLDFVCHLHTKLGDSGSRKLKCYKPSSSKSNIAFHYCINCCICRKCHLTIMWYLLAFDTFTLMPYEIWKWNSKLQLSLFSFACNMHIEGPWSVSRAYVQGWLESAFDHRPYLYLHRLIRTMQCFAHIGAWKRESL